MNTHDKAIHEALEEALSDGEKEEMFKNFMPIPNENGQSIFAKNYICSIEGCNVRVSEPYRALHYYKWHK